MKWTVIFFLCILPCAVFGLLGLTLGISLNPESTVKFVPNWGSLGDWASAIGAFSAVAFALWQSHKQQLKELPKVRIIHRFTTDELLVRVVSEGVVPESVLSADLIYHEDGSKIDLFAFSNISKGGRDTKLQRGDHLDVVSVNKNGIYGIAERWAAPTIAKLHRSNIDALGDGFKLDKRFFEAIDELFAQRSYFLIRLVSKDVVVELDAEFTKFVSGYISNTRKAEATEKVASFNQEAQARLDAGLFLDYGEPKS
ncbi:hypothetical protein QF043_002500 [Pseudomonas sp. W3I7]|uniref:hypothetical protein n=1 Tax=Pseudomonas sp. W3I7 TaxID=3042292 RepID=UPI00278F91EB|nr:hypothetical protein [Pseudomonas sp. W3I7]MDQ0703708.1 hypothetical protein [Pseudomonas sp. W3I7]